MRDDRDDMMNAEKLQDAIGLVGDDLIRDAHRPRSRRPLYIRWAVIAACFVLVAVMIPVSLFVADRYDVVRTPVAMEDPWRGMGGDPWGSIAEESFISLNSPPPTVSVTARAIAISPDTYRIIIGGDTSTYRLVRFETINALVGLHMVEEFYYLLPEKYTDDLTLYDAIVLYRIPQVGCEGSVLYNVDKGQAEVLELVLFGHDDPESDLLAFVDGIFDPCLWPEDEAWKEKDMVEEGTFLNIVGSGWTLEQTEEVLRRSGKDDPLEVYTLKGKHSKEVAAALNYTSSLENGMFVPVLYDGMVRFHGASRLAIRYIHGFPTNERVWIVYDKVSYSEAQFTSEDMARLPDLEGALMAVNAAYDAREITPPHIQGYEELTLDKYGVFGWYAKTDSGVYGIIRVSWQYQAPKDYWRSCYFRDDRYYVVTYGEAGYESVDRDELLAMLGESDDYVYTGTYNETGKTR